MGDKLKIAYVTEKDLSSHKVSGAELKDIKLLEVLRESHSVDVIYVAAKTTGRFGYLFHKNGFDVSLIEKVANYDLVIVSVNVVSENLFGYLKLKDTCCLIFYLGDSMYHEAKQRLSIKYSILVHILLLFERRLLKRVPCMYLGRDEIDCLPLGYRDRALACSFAVKENSPLFDPDGPFVLVGQFGYRPNMEMLKFVCDNAYRFKRKVYVYGINIPELKYPDVVVIKGYVDKVSDIYRGKSCLLYPVQYGVGIKNKVVEATSYSIPTVGFSGAFTNLPVTHNVDCIIARDREDFFSALDGEDFKRLSVGTQSLADKLSLEKVSCDLTIKLKRFLINCRNEQGGRI